MPRPDAMSSRRVARRARGDLRPRPPRGVEPEHVGKFLVLDVETGDYEIDAERVRRGPTGRWPSIPAGRSRFLFRIGYPAAHRIGGSSLRPVR